MSWVEANQRHLAAAIAEVRRLFAKEPAVEEPAMAPPHPHRPFALDAITATFDLSSFERRLLVLCAGVDLDSALAALCPSPTFSLALAMLPDAHWSAITPAAPLRRWRLIELAEGGGVAAAPLRIDERVLHFLAGIDELDPRLAAVVEVVSPEGEVPESHAAAAERIVALWSAASRAGERIEPVQLCGADLSARRGVAAAASAHLGLMLYAMPALSLPTNPAELDAWARFCERESWLSGGALLLECDAVDAVRAEAVRQFAGRVSVPLIVSARDGHAGVRAAMTLDVPRPRPAEQRALWLAALGDTSQRIDGMLDRVTAQFALTPESIRGVAAAVADEADPGAAMWTRCRAIARRRVDDVAQRIESGATRHDLILPELQRKLLDDLVTCVRWRGRVYDDWGFAARDWRGAGVTALFCGVSGTGKTLAAEVIANELGLDLYRVDLSGVVSKYIGETEKNLRRVFEAAEESGAILLFDEADALFGRRSEVKDSHDRYANIEVSYLLQRMEAYRGVAILTTNVREALDPAFLRRIRFVVQFPFPAAAERLEIWQRMFPDALPRQNVDAEKLARLAVAGGNIRNITVNAAFGAARDGTPVTMRHLLDAARTEYAKLEKTLSSAETEGWA